ncbi:MAG: nickel-dependent hydrogenase large subunit, partial [Acidobacteria bacterium]|nr:nickel-dependent hydrogenase large subunit [Acidobacteriota bacterium]
GLASKVAGTTLGPEVLHSTLGRHAARAVRAAMLSELALEHWQRLVDNIEAGDRAVFNAPTFPKGEQKGFGFHEAPRGVLSHWIVIQDGKIANYQCVVPSTWNAGPRDGQDQMGPYEASLVGNPIADEERPLEVLRTIHSFDPCLACAIHAHDPDGKSLFRVKVM